MADPVIRWEKIGIFTIAILSPAEMFRIQGTGRVDGDGA